MASVVYESENLSCRKAKNCLAEEHMNVAITKGERSCYSADRVSKRFENRETRQLIDGNNN